MHQAPLLLASVSRNFISSSVRSGPGRSALTRMFSRAWIAASSRDRDRIPPLLAVYAICAAAEPISATHRGGVDHRAAAGALQRRDAVLAAEEHAHGKLDPEFYQPLKTDPQLPHTRDEVYFVISGSGWSVRAGERQRFAPGEVLYVPAGVPHRFEEFTDDFATWAIFSG